MPDQQLPTALTALLRLEVAGLRSATPGASFTPSLHVGLPAGPRCSAVLDQAPAADAGLRFDLASALVQTWALRDCGDPAEAAEPCCWLTRPGVPALHDLDAQWHAAARRALEAHGQPWVAFLAVTRTGWLDVVSGEQRTWKRLRLRPGQSQVCTGSLVCIRSR